MKISLKYILLLAILVFPTVLFSQDKKPKVALVLSGGGAKGLAHIPVLQALDSLGIVPDLIIGTSMGSVVGGLYAMGYSGDEISKIANDANWDVLLGGDISLDKVSVEEKSEFKRYLIEMDVIGWKPKMNTSLLRDQNLREFLSKLTFPVYDVSDFDELPIPFRAIATDIVKGKEIVIGEGSLAIAMRASMSIPSIFEPVDYKEYLLVDGGVLNNFPVDVALDMGSDFVIGSNVGDGMLSKENLNTIPSILFQTSMMNSNIKNDKNVKLCDIYINHTPNIKESTGDFNKSESIFEEGKIATNQNMEALTELANQIKNYPQKKHLVPFKKKEVVLDTLIFKGISKENIGLVKARTNIEANKKYQIHELISGLNRAIGTRRFNKINFTSIKESGKIGLELTGFEHSKNQIKGSLHFDTNRGVGLILNYTGTNILGKASRVLIDVDIAEQSKIRIQYQKNFTKKYNWWFRTETLGVLLKQQMFYNGTNIDDIRYNYFQFDNQVNRNFNSLKSFVGFGVNYEYTKLKPSVDPDVLDNVFGLDNYYFNNIEINLHYSYNNLNNVFFASHGSSFYAKISRSVLHEMYFKPTVSSIDEEVKGSTNGFTKLNLQYEKRFKLNKKFVGIVNASSSFIFEDKLSDNEISFEDFGFAAKYFLGGNMPNERNNSNLFPGLKEDELNVSQFMKLNLALQYNPINKIYITPHVNVASVGFFDFDTYMEDAFSPKGNWVDNYETSAIYSGGITFSYHSILGPVNFDISYVNKIDKVRLFFSLGLLFNESK